MQIHAFLFSGLTRPALNLIGEQHAKNLNSDIFFYADPDQA